MTELVLNQYYPGGCFKQISDAAGGQNIVYDQNLPGGAVEQLRKLIDPDMVWNQNVPGGVWRQAVVKVSATPSVPAWVPVNAKIHIDLLGSTPQGRAWVAGTGEVAVNTLLGSDPLSVASYGNTGYSPVYLIPDGYPGVGGSVPAFLGVAKSMLLASATMALQFKNFTTVASPVSLLYMGAENGDDLIAAEAMVASTKKVRISSVADFNFSTTNLVDTTIGAVNKIALTVAALRMEIALNGGAAVGGAMTTADRPPGNPFVFALFDMQASAAQSITIYDPLPSTVGLSALSTP